VLSIADENWGPSLSLFPNPANDHIHIAASQRIMGYQIFDLSGKLISYKNHINATEHLIELDSISKGIYLIKVDNENRTVTKKLIIN
ncbi:MAG: T9SS type A sorting domain-containing protein, partial [Bacteroidota bacterium]